MPASSSWGFLIALSEELLGEAVQVAIPYQVTPSLSVANELHASLGFSLTTSSTMIDLGRSLALKS